MKRILAFLLLLPSIAFAQPVSNLQVGTGTGTTGSTIQFGTVDYILSVGANNRLKNVPATFPASSIAVGTPVTGGTPNGIFYNSANTFGNLATTASGVLVTSAGSVPSISTTLPAVNASAATVISTGSTTARSLATRFAEHANVLDFGAVADWNGTTGTDNTAAFALALATGKNVYVPAGSYKVLNPSLLRQGQAIYGDGRTESIIAVPSTFNLSATSSAASLAGTTLTVGGTVGGQWAVGQIVDGVGVSTLTKIVALGTGTGGAGTYTVDTTQTVGPVAMTGAPAGVITLAIGENGGTVSNLGIAFYQPDTAVRASLIAYPPGIDTSNAARFRIDGVRVSAGMTCIDMLGNSGGAVLTNLELGCFDAGIYADGSLDTVWIDTINLYPFGTGAFNQMTTNQKTIFADADTWGLDIMRVDNYFLDKIAGQAIGNTLRLRASPSDPTLFSNGRIGTLSVFDGGGVTLSDGTVGVAEFDFAATGASNYGWRQTGGNSTFGAINIRDLVGTTDPAISIDGGGIVTSLAYGALTSNSYNFDSTTLFADGGGTTQIALGNTIISRFVNVAYTKPSVHIGAARGTLSGLSTFDKGTGAGTLLKVDTLETWLQLPNINPVGWTIDLPVGQKVQAFEGPISAPVVTVATTLTMPDTAAWTATGLANTATYNTSSTQAFSWAPTWNFSSTASGWFSIALGGTIVPTGATAGNGQAIQIAPQIGTSAVNISTYRGINLAPSTAAGYSGVLSAAEALRAGFTNGGTNAVANAYNVISGALTNGNGITTGTVNNNGFYSTGFTMAAAAGGTLNNFSYYANLPSGSGAGTTSNYGLYITGNGGSGGGGTTNNYALFSNSTAPSVFGGTLGLKGYAIAALPATAAAGMFTGAKAYVTDALNAGACAFNVAVTVAGGSTFCPVIYNGAAWVGG